MATYQPQVENKCVNFVRKLETLLKEIREEQDRGIYDVNCKIQCFRDVSISYISP